MQSAAPRRLTAGVAAVVISAAAPVIVLAALRAAEAPLGCPNRFVYLYSPVPRMRVEAVPAGLAIAGVIAIGVLLAAHASARRRSMGVLAVVAAFGALAVWVYRAPPEHRNQHVFNMNSPSQDGAFVSESALIGSLTAYLRGFPARAATPPEQMRGTRVISNPPGATMIAYGVGRVLAASPALQRWTSSRIRGELAGDPRLEALAPRLTHGLVYAAVLQALWAASFIPLLLAARVFMPAAPAAAFAICASATPAVLLFSPGKDTAQLLTAGCILCLGVAAAVRCSAVAAALAGAAAVAGAVMSLAHVWLAAIVFVAALAECVRRRAIGRFAVRVAAPAAIGVLACAAGLRLLGLDLWSTARAVAAAQAAVTRGPDAMPLAWQALGIPLFLLFLSPAPFVYAAVRARGAGATITGGDRAAPHAPLGRDLLLLTVVVLIATVGFTNIETPRLWIPFVPLMLLGAWLWSGLPSRAGRTLALMVFCHLVCGLLTWVLMDMREAEQRLVAGYFYGQ